MATVQELENALEDAIAAGDQGLIAELADAVANAQDAASTNLTGGTTAVPTEGGGGLVDTGSKVIEQSLAGVNEGLADIVGGPVDLVTAGINKVSDLVGGPEQLITDPIGGSASIRGAAGDTLIKPPREGFETSRRFGRLTGQGAGTVATLGLAGPLARTAGLLPKTRPPVAPRSPPTTRVGRLGDTLKRSGAALVEGSRQSLGTPVRTLAAEAAASGGLMAGGEAGEALGEQFGFDETGRTLGELVGSFSPAAALGAGRGAARFATARPDSPQIMESLERSGISPTPGVVGKQSLAVLENTAKDIPLVGEPLRSKDQLQFDQFGTGVQRTAENIRGPEGAVPDIDTGSMGERVTTAATAGEAAARAEITAGEDQLSAMVGDRTPVDVRPTQRRIDELEGQTEPVLAQALGTERRNLEAIRTEPIDAGIHPRLIRDRNQVVKRLEQSEAQAQSLQAQLERTATKIVNGKPIGPVGGQTKARIDKQLEALNRSIAGQRQAVAKAEQLVDENLGVPFEQARDFRSQVGKRTEGSNISTGQQGQIYETLSGGFRSLARQLGAGEHFERLMKRERQLLGKDQLLSEGKDIPYLHRLSKQDTGQAFNQIIEGGRKNVERWEVLKRNMAPQEWANLAGDIFERMGLARGANAGAEGDVFSPQVFLDNWNKTTEASRNLLIPDGRIRQEISDLATSGDALLRRKAERQTSGNLKAGAALVGLGSAAVNLPATLGIASGAVAGIGLYSALGRVLSRTIAGQTPTFGQRVLSRAPGQIGREGAEAVEDNSLQIELNTPRAAAQ